MKFLKLSFKSSMGKLRFGFKFGRKFISFSFKNTCYVITFRK